MSSRAFTQDVISLLIEVGKRDVGFSDELRRIAECDNAEERFRANVVFGVISTLGKTSTFVANVVQRAVNDHVDWHEVVAFFKS